MPEKDQDYQDEQDTEFYEDYDEERDRKPEFDTERDELIARDRAADQVRDGLSRLMSSWSQRPKLLAHYTSVENAVRIISSGTIWLFNSYTMNDEAEIDHALELIQDELANAEFSHLLSEMKLSFALAGQLPVYTFSLSEAHLSEDLDRLSMWRAYGHDGQGAVIILRAEAISDGPNTELTPTIARVVYDKETKADRIRALAREFERLCKATDFGYGHLSDALVEALFAITPTFKHEGFAEEREYRAIVKLKQSSPFDLEEGMDSHRLVTFLDNQRPFVPIKLKRAKYESPFVLAMVGPSRNTRAGCAAISAALRQAGANGRVLTSALPYRGK